MVEWPRIKGVLNDIARSDVMAPLGTILIQITEWNEWMNEPTSAKTQFGCLLTDEKNAI